jgi:hypothetical protein
VASGWWLVVSGQLKMSAIARDAENAGHGFPQIFTDKTIKDKKVYPC